MQVEHCITGDGEEIRNFVHHIKRRVDKGWYDDVNGIDAVQENADREAQGRQRRQRYIDCSLKRLRPRYPQPKAQEYLMENLNATWNDFSTRIFQADVSFQVFSNFLSNEGQTKSQMATLGQKMKNLQPELQQHRVKAAGGKPRKVDPNRKGRQTATRFCTYCSTNGHTPNWCRKKVRDEELKRIENEGTAEKKVMFTQDYKKNEDQTMDQKKGQVARISKGGTGITLTMDSGETPPLTIRSSPQGQTTHMGTTIRLMEDQMINAQISHSKEAIEIDLEMDFSKIMMETGEVVVIILVLHRFKRETFHKIFHTSSQQVINQTNLPSADLTNDQRRFTRYEQIFHKAITRRFLMWSASQQPMIPLTIYQTSLHKTTNVSELEHRQISISQAWPQYLLLHHRR